MTIEEIRQIWTQTYNTHGKADWSHIFSYYPGAIIFQDSIQGIEGKAAFEAMCERLANRARA